MTDEKREELGKLIEALGVMMVGTVRERFHQIAAQLRADGERIKALEEALARATEYAQNLAVSMAKEHYAYQPDESSWRVQDDLVLVLTQIDNMTTGLVRAGPPEESK